MNKEKSLINRVIKEQYYTNVTKYYLPFLKRKNTYRCLTIDAERGFLFVTGKIMYPKEVENATIIEHEKIKSMYLCWLCSNNDTLRREKGVDKARFSMNLHFRGKGRVPACQWCKCSLAKMTSYICFSMDKEQLIELLKYGSIIPEIESEPTEFFNEL